MFEVTCACVSLLKLVEKHFQMQEPRWILGHSARLKSAFFWIHSRQVVAAGSVCSPDSERTVILAVWLLHIRRVCFHHSATVHNSQNTPGCIEWCGDRSVFIPGFPDYSNPLQFSEPSWNVAHGLQWNGKSSKLVGGIGITIRWWHPLPAPALLGDNSGKTFNQRQ